MSTCTECKGKGYIDLLTSRVSCMACGGMKQLVPGDPCMVRVGGDFDTPEAAKHVEDMRDMADRILDALARGDGVVFDGAKVAADRGMVVVDDPVIPFSPDDAVKFESLVEQFRSVVYRNGIMIDWTTVPMPDVADPWHWPTTPNAKPMADVGKI